MKIAQSAPVLLKSFPADQIETGFEPTTSQNVLRCPIQFAGISMLPRGLLWKLLGRQSKKVIKVGRFELEPGLKYAISKPINISQLEN